MNILCIAFVENDKNIKAQIAKQTVQPDDIFIYVDSNPAVKLDDRRKRIAHNQNILKEVVQELKPDYVWQLEGDCDLHEDTLKMLISSMLELIPAKDFGYVSGIQVGRHGLYCLGAWTDFTDKSFKSLDYKLQGIQEVDATGFYCLLAPTKVWLQGMPSWDGEPYGPDVVWGLSLREKGYKIYCNMDIEVGHIVYNGIIRPSDLSTCNANFYKEGNTWNYKQIN